MQIIKYAYRNFCSHNELQDFCYFCETFRNHIGLSEVIQKHLPALSFLKSRLLPVTLNTTIILSTLTVT